MKNFILLILLALSLLACSGTESLGIDKIPPEKPEMIPHLGDSGDTINGQTNFSFYGFSEMEENGIDTLPDGDKIKIEWEPLLDNDIDYVRIHRFSEQAYLADSLAFSNVIDSLTYTGRNYYIDNFQGESQVVGNSWFYFIEPFDTAGNSTLSDTVCYKILNKPLVQTPADFTETDDINELIFSWEITNDAVSYRIVLFNLERQVVWSRIPLDYENTTIPYDGPDLASGDYIFRIESFGYTMQSVPIADKIYQIPSGSEAAERLITVN